MNAKHTPGPWKIQTIQEKIHGYECWNSYMIRSPQNVHLATVGDVDRYHEKNHLANARLIKAAPALLYAIQEILTARDYVLSHGGDIMTSSTWALLERAEREAVEK